MAEAAIKEIVKAIPSFFRLKFPQAWFDYDKEADVLYISFERPQRASESELMPNDILVRRRGRRVVGLSVLNASRFKK